MNEMIKVDGGLATIRETKTGKVYSVPGMKECKASMLALFPDATNAKIAELTREEYKRRKAEYVSAFRDVEHGVKQSGFLPVRFSYSENDRCERFAPVYVKDKPKAATAKTSKALAITKTDKMIIDAMIAGGVEDENLYVNTIAGKRDVSADRIREAVLEYVNKADVVTA